jgi:hypothetical protein
MFRYRHHHLLYSLIVGLIIVAAGCNLTKPISFEVQPDESDLLEYGFGGGELGADYTQISIRGDGQVTFYYLLPYWGTWPQEQIVKEHQLADVEVEALFQSLVDAGLFNLTNQQTQGADVPRTTIKASIDNHELDISFDGTPDETIHSHITKLIQEIYPVSFSACYALELAERFTLIEPGASRGEVTVCLSDPAEIQEYNLPASPFSGPSEGLAAILDPGTPIEEWIYHDDDTSYYFWFASTTGEAEENWGLIDKAAYPKGAVF